MSSSKRLSPQRDFTPWRHASELKLCQLYWIPVSSFPIPAAQRGWLMSFIGGLKDLVAQKFGLRPQLFLQASAMTPALYKVFRSTAPEFAHIIGLNRRFDIPGSAASPSEKTTEPEPEDYLHPSTKQCYWFLDRSDESQRQAFFGHGGMTIIFLKPDPKTASPGFMVPQATRRHPLFAPIFDVFDIDRMQSHLYATLDGFLLKSKELFGVGLENYRLVKASMFVLPQLGAGDFVSKPADQVQRWFELFDLYFSESPDDGGVVLASKLDVQDALTELLDKMKAQGLIYPEE